MKVRFQDAVAVWSTSFADGGKESDRVSTLDERGMIKFVLQTGHSFDRIAREIGEISRSSGEI